MTASTLLRGEGGKKLTSEEMVELCAGWVEQYPIISIEDGLAEDDWDGWELLTKKLGDKIQLVGDDLFVTNVERLARGIKEGAAQLDPDQAEPDRLAHRDHRGHRDGGKGGWTAMVSHRSGETEDTFIADLAVAWAPARSRPVRRPDRAGSQVQPTAAHRR